MGRPDYDVLKRALEEAIWILPTRPLRAVQTAPHEAAYQSALKQATNTLAEAQYTAGMRHLEQREYANAYRCLKRASELAPDNAECQKEMLRARVLAGNEAVAANPDGADAHRKLAAAQGLARKQKGDGIAWPFASSPTMETCDMSW